jgi:hypothetical protein
MTETPLLIYRKYEKRKEKKEENVKEKGENIEV